MAAEAAAGELPVSVGERTQPGRRLRQEPCYHEVMRLLEACYEEGLLRPTEPLPLRPGERVGLIVVRRPDPNRWNLDRLAKAGKAEDLALAEQGLGDWAQALDMADRP